MADAETGNAQGEEQPVERKGGLAAMEDPKDAKETKIVRWTTRSAALVQMPYTLLSFMSVGVPLVMLPAAALAGNGYLSPKADSQQQTIGNVKNMEETFQVMEQEINRFEKENKKLKSTIRKLESSVQGMESSQNALDSITKQQTQNIDEFEEQVEMAKEVLAELKADAKSGIIQTLLTVIVASDLDGDFTIDPDEVDVLIKNIEGTGQLGINEGLLRSKIEENGGEIQALLDICKSILEDDGTLPMEEKIFWLKE